MDARREWSEAETRGFTAERAVAPLVTEGDDDVRREGEALEDIFEFAGVADSSRPRTHSSHVYPDRDELHLRVTRQGDWPIVLPPVDRLIYIQYSCCAPPDPLVSASVLTRLD